jgi:glucosamine kinase
VACAQGGDAVAQEVLEQGGRDLASLAGLVIEHIRKIETESAVEASGPFQLPGIAIAGSILEHVAPVRHALEVALHSSYPGIVVLETPADPAAGALWNARHRKTIKDLSPSGSGL